MRKRVLVEYTLTPEETQTAILEYIARKEGRSDLPVYRYIGFKYERDSKGVAKKTYAVALTEQPEE